MAVTPTDLYRRGNATSPRMTHVRVGKDVVTYFQNGVEMVHAFSGGISTFAVRGPGQNWWILPGGTQYPDELSVINDHGDHYSWEPNVNMPLADYMGLLGTVERVFQKTS